MATDPLLLEALAERFPNAERAASEAATLRATLELPRPTIHVISDIHGEHRKLRHILNNASGSLRPLVAEIFADEIGDAEQEELLKLIYYPREFIERVAPVGHRRHVWVRETLRRLFRIVRNLAAAYRSNGWKTGVEPQFRELFRELFVETVQMRPPAHIDAMLDALAPHGLDLSAVRHACRLVRNLSVSEIVVGGDLGDRGSRIDKVIDLLMQQPKVRLTWGNHDIAWMGACVGQDALLATVLRNSLRYTRLWQIEEGYGISLAPLEQLVRKCYADDPAERFRSKRGATVRTDEMVARMQKAAAILQFKLEAQTIRRRPEWGMEERVLLDRVDFAQGEFDGLAMRDTHFPTVDPADPLALHPAEQACLERMRDSFIGSARLWEQMRWVVERGSMSMVRDQLAIFHACIPCDEDGGFLELELEGRKVAGKAMFEAFERIIRRAFSAGGYSAREDDKDWLYYLWAGPRSPLFGKDRMATFESYFLADPTTHKEVKNPYFRLLHDREFADRVAREIGVERDGIVINGHIPVRPEKGETPVKDGGNAVTIDGAFSEAYGDRGYTLILGAGGISLAEHHHFDSVSDALDHGHDIVPKITALRKFDPLRRRGDTAEAAHVEARIRALEDLVDAFRIGDLRP